MSMLEKNEKIKRLNKEIESFREELEVEANGNFRTTILNRDQWIDSRAAQTHWKKIWKLKEIKTQNYSV